MRILHVCNDYYYSTLYEAFQKALSSRGLDSIIFVPSSFQEGNQQENQKVTQLKCYNKYDRYFYYRKQKKITNVIERHISNKKPDCLHAHFLFSAGYTCMQIKQKYQIPYIVAVRNTDVNLFFKKMIHLRSVGTQIMLNAEKIVFISPAYRDYVIKQYVHEKYKSIISEKSIVIPNGIDAFWLNNKFVRNIGSERKKLTIIYVGSVDKNKNIETAIRACDLLIKQGYDIKYKIIGKIAKIGYNVKIGHNCSIDGDITIGDNTEIWDNVIMRNKIEIGANSTIQSGVCIGHDGFAFTEDKNYIKKMVKHYGGVRIGDNVFIGAHSTIIRGTIDNTEIGEGVKIDAFCLVAHNVVIENHAAIYGGAVLGGSVHIEPYAHVVSAIVKNQIRIGGNALVGTGSVVVKDVEPNVVVAGNLARAIDKRTPIKMND